MAKIFENSRFSPRQFVVEFKKIMPRKSILPTKLSPPTSFLTILTLTLTLTLILLLLSSSSLLFSPLHHPTNSPCTINSGNLTRGHWTLNPHHKNHPTNSLYNSSCPFHRNAWNCLRNARENMEKINSWAWIPEGFGGLPLPRIDPAEFLSAMRGRRLGFVGDSLNENLVVALLCALRSADGDARRWKRNGAWRGGYFPRFDFTVGYHRAVLLAKIM